MKPYTHFTLTERNNIQQFLTEGKSFREIARLLGRSPSSISREVKRNYSYKKKDIMLGELQPCILSAEETA